MTNPASTGSDIEAYIARFARALGGVPREDRDDFAAEIRSHLTLRAASIGASAAIAELGSPEHCAAGFLDELRLQAAIADGAPATSFAALTSVAGRKVLGAAGVLIAACFYLFALGFFLTACVEVIAPDLAGAWYNPTNGDFEVGIMFGDHSGARELAGWALAPLSLAAAVGLYLVGAIVSRNMVRLLLSHTRQDRRLLSP
ncbi:MAG: hypothetical protein NT015_18535 [Alphaproteobacteria bacterium]|nr:hypothetical protein [Alphaproteobacteria bacterium]